LSPCNKVCGAKKRFNTFSRQIFKAQIRAFRRCSRMTARGFLPNRLSPAG
jgi:hypothetical protein